MPGAMQMQIILKADTVSIRKHNQLMNAAHRQMGQTWKDDILKLHFEHGAKNKYRYQPRRSTIHYGQAIKHGLPKSTALQLLNEARERGQGRGNRIAYWRMKAAMGKPDNVLSGRLRDSTPAAVVRHTAKRGTVTGKFPFPMRHDARAELEKVTKTEQEQLFRRAHNFYNAEVRKPQNMTKTARKIG